MLATLARKLIDTARGCDESLQSRATGSIEAAAKTAQAIQRARKAATDAAIALLVAGGDE